MSLEIPNSESDRKDLCSKIYERVIQILEYQNENPQKDWKDNPELVYIDLQDNKEEYMVRKIDLENNEDEGGINMTLFYISSEVPFMNLKRIQLADCQLYSFKISDKEKEKRVRELISPITITTYEYKEPDSREVAKILRKSSE